MSYKNYNIRDNCFYCERKFSFDRFGGSDYGTFVIKTKDHIIPTSKGGKEFKPNIVVCCRVCNNLKGDLIIDELIEKIKNLISSGSTFGNIPKNLLYKIQLKAEELKGYIEKQGDALYYIKRQPSISYIPV